MTVDLSDIATWREDITARLSQLDSRRLAAFASLCAERLLPLYQALELRTGWGQAQTLRESIETTWAYASGGEPDLTRLDDLRVRCQAATPDTVDFDDGLVSRALDAAVAVADALAVASGGSVADAAEAAEVSIESAFALAQADDSTSGLQEVFLGPTVQAEILGQQRVIAELATAADVNRRRLSDIAGPFVVSRDTAER